MHCMHGLLKVCFISRNNYEIKLRTRWTVRFKINVQTLQSFNLRSALYSSLAMRGRLRVWIISWLICRTQQTMRFVTLRWTRNELHNDLNILEICESIFVTIILLCSSGAVFFPVLQIFFPKKKHLFPFTNWKV